MGTFQLRGLESRPFAPLFELPDAELARRGITRCIADSDTGYPCRVSLEDAAVGEELLLLHYEHHAVASPYRASGPIFVRRGQAPRVLAPGDVPAYVTRRLISLRAYDADHVLVSGEVADGAEVGPMLEQVFDNPAVAYVHLHNARNGCFSCEAVRSA